MPTKASQIENNAAKVDTDDQPTPTKQAEEKTMEQLQQLLTNEGFRVSVNTFFKP